MQVARAPSPTLQNGRDVNSNASALAPQSFDFLSLPPPSGVVASVSRSANASSLPSDDPVELFGQNTVYADVARGPVISSEPAAYVPDPQNELPSRPLTVFFNPHPRVHASEVFEALQAAGLDNSRISCIQRQSSGELVLTFRNTVLVAGKSREELTENTDIFMNSELPDNELKQKIPDRPIRTSIRNIDKYFLICFFSLCLSDFHC